MLYYLRNNNQQSCTSQIGGEEQTDLLNELILVEMLKRSDDDSHWRGQLLSGNNFS